MGTGDEDRPEALLTGMDTALADLIVPAAAVLPEEEGPFQPPLLTPAHRSWCSHLLQGLLEKVRGHLAGLHREGDYALGDFFLHRHYLLSPPPYRSWLTREV